MIKDAAVIDFETEPIEDRPKYPPKPVGVAIWIPGQKPKYLAWSHPTGNNCTRNEAIVELEKIYNSGSPLLFHSAKFDLEVAEVHMDLPLPQWQRVHDTLPMLFLHNPHAESFALKESAEALLGEPPEEQDRVVNWLMDNQPVEGVKLSRSKKSPNFAGGYISYAPVKIAGPYAIGDVRRTKKLAQFLYPKIVASEMLDAYNRERALLYPTMDMEKHGIKIATRKLARDIKLFEAQLLDIDTKLRRRLGDINLNSSQQLVGALLKKGLADESLLGVTRTGKICSDKEAIAMGVTSKPVLTQIQKLRRLTKQLNTFMRPWYESASKYGRIFTSWHSTRREKSGSGVGARTGRFSSTPNFQNIEELLRVYLVPESGHVLINRDYNQQELRILGHYEDGGLRDSYQVNPRLDMHEHARQLINMLLGMNLDRKPVKTTGFGLIYGMGLGKLAEQSNITVDMARKVRDAYLKAFPGLKDLQKDLRICARHNQPIRTWGGRLYHCEPPKLINGELKTYEYKLLNVLIQGSAADCTKEALIQYFKVKPKHHRVLLTIHDEITVSVPKKEAHEAMRQLKECMESVEFDVPMLSDGKWSSKSLGDFKPWRGK